ncbi:hypothetical protein [Catenulispora rubra]|uniref:hypothetical protein n=1 Tax=Catenulispora rubra TaxID=280293 RepID=UPI00189218A8|nr:hypothetical protein [Catenulispora rubra]
MNDDQFEPGTGGSGGAGTGTGTGLGADADQEMFADLGRFTTGAIPVDAVVRHGKAIRTRRRAVGGGALAIAAALSIGVPVAIAGGSAGAGAASGGSGPNGVYGATGTGGRVTVNPVRLTDGKGHFSGAVDGKKWSVDFDNKNCYYIQWSCGFTDLYPWDQYASLSPNSSWGLQGQPDDYTMFLNKNVARAAITLQDGEVLNLEAVPTARVPVVLFALPFGLGVSKIELFDTHGAELAYAMPFNIKGSASAAGHWYKPGETPAKDSGSVELARSVFGPGEETVISAYAGPAGPCVVFQAGGKAGGHPSPECSQTAVVNGTVLIGKDPVRGDATNIQDSGYGIAGSKADHMELDFSDGTKSPVAIKSLGGYRFYAYFVPKGKTLTKVTAFDSRDKALPVQKGAPVTLGEQKWPSPDTTR